MTRVAKSLRDLVKKSDQHIGKILLSKSEDLICRNMFCDKVSLPCKVLINKSSQSTALSTCSTLWILSPLHSWVYMYIYIYIGLCRLEQAICYADLSTVTHLNLSSNRLTELPPSLDHMINLEYLDLSDNQLTSLPKSVLEFDQLKCVTLHGNNFTHTIDAETTIEYNDLAAMKSWLFK